MRKLIPGLVVLVAATVFSIWAYPQLPAEVATHFDLQGDPNGWSSRLAAVLLVPGLALLFIGFAVVLPRIDPRQANYALFTPTYWTLINALLILLGVIHVGVLGKALGWPVDMGTMASLGVGGIFVVLGNVMTRIRPNWFMGIRTPWTLSSDDVWRKTHRFGGVAFTLAGLCFIASALSTAPWAKYAAFATVIAAALGSVVYSYLVWKRQQGGAGADGMPAKP